MYELHYNLLKENYGIFFNLVYIGTDSFLLDFKNVDVYKEMQNSALKEHIDPSNFPTNNPLYSKEIKGKIGLLKPETGDNPIFEVICLAPKCYSVLLED